MKDEDSQSLYLIWKVKACEGFSLKTILLNLKGK